jgi:DNA-binding NarL/FixJ family response regulator
MAPSDTPSLLRVLLVEDNLIFAESVKQHLSLLSGISVVGHAVDGPTAIDCVQKLHPDLILMDISLGAMSGFDIANFLQSPRGQQAIIFLTMHEAKAYREKAFKVGAKGYVQKDNFVRDLPPLIAQIVAKTSEAQSPIHI